MGKLINLKSSLGVLRPSVAYMPQGERERDKLRAALPWRQWYQTAEWKALRLAVMVRDRFTCQMPGCGRIGGKMVADHKVPHRGDRALFFDILNLWALCKPCHDGAKQREEARARR